MNDKKTFTRRQVFRSLFFTGGAVASLFPLRSMASALQAMCGLTPSQTEGPFYPPKGVDDACDLTRVKGHPNRAKGQVINVMGQILDKDCQPISGARVEVWQACASGRYNHPDDTNPAAVDPDFEYSGYDLTDKNGVYKFLTIRPGAYPASETWTRPSHIHFKVFAKGYFDLTTQMYFKGDPYNAKDEILNAIRNATERNSVIVDFVDAGQGFEAGSKVGQFNITMKKVGG